jgi:hypothetical protein
MIKKSGILLLTVLLLAACGPEGVQKEGNDLTLNTTITVNDLLVVGPVSLKQTQMISGNVQRSEIKTGVTIGGETQELISVYIINLDEGNLYFINDPDSTYVKMSFAEFDSMLSSVSLTADSTAPALSLTGRDVVRLEAEKKEIGEYGECMPVQFDLVLGGGDDTRPYESKFSGKMWLSSSIKNGKLFTAFQNKSFQMFKSSLASGPGFFGLAGAVNLDENWLAEVNAAMTGIPVEAEFIITMPGPDETTSYGITLNLDGSASANIDQSLLAVPAGYHQVEFSQFRMY